MDKRWKLRYDNFKKAFTVFKRRLNEYQKKREQEAEQMALIQAFDIICELSWKLQKDYLEEQGFSSINSPNNVIRTANTAGIIEHTEIWLSALENRNLSSHTYNKNIADNLLDFIETKFAPLLNNFNDLMETEIDK